jgi:transposase
VVGLDPRKPKREEMILVYSKAIPRIPKETLRAANAVFGRSNFYILVGAHLEGILEDLERQYFLEGEPPANPEEVCLPLITFFQFVEGLTDLQALDAVRTRTDWKFALHLSLIPARLHENALCQFRQRVLRDPLGQREFQRLIDRLVVFVPALHNHLQTLKVLEIVAIVCTLNRLNRAQQAMQQALEALAGRFPEWLRKITLPHWYGRYNPTVPRLEVATLPGKQWFLMEEIASDINHLLENVHQSDSQEISGLLEIRLLEQVWKQQFQSLKQAGADRLELFSHGDCERCSHAAGGGRH